MTKTEITGSIHRKYVPYSPVLNCQIPDKATIKKQIKSFLFEEEFSLSIAYIDKLYPGFQNKFNDMILFFERAFMLGGFLSATFTEDDYKPPFLRPITHDFLFLFREVNKILELENIKSEDLIDIEIIRKYKEWSTLERRELYDYKEKKFSKGLYEAANTYLI